jgi:serine protease AprX
MAKSKKPSKGGIGKTGTGKKRARKDGTALPAKGLPDRSVLGMERSTIPPALYEDSRRVLWGLSASPAEAGDYMIELNLAHPGGIEEASRQFRKLFAGVSDEVPDEVSKSYFGCRASLDQIRQLVRLDEAAADGDRSKLAIYKVWPDFPIRATVDRSVATVKGDAAARSFAASGEGIVWAVIDSGVQADHRHFEANGTLTDQSVVQLHRDFTSPTEPTKTSATTDEYGHGTHVGGIIAGHLTNDEASPFEVYQRTYETTADNQTNKVIKRREFSWGSTLSGVAPLCRIVSLKVLDGSGAGKTSNVMKALNYIRESVNGDPKMLRIHGVNLSLGYEFDAEMFACGQSPLCVEVDRLVNSGVVVVTAAGNTGYGRLTSDARPTRVGLANTINDPGNAALAITVGSTHRDAPHTYGVSYFSSKGPTGDGRLKPDVVAPGERITSCAAGKYLQANGGSVPDGKGGYIDDSGTSMAAPHVSGAIAAFLSIRREFIQKPLQVKKIFLDTATCLGRERYFQGNGLVDLMRAIQSV